TRYVSLGSIAATVAFPVCVWLLSAFVRPVEGLKEILTVAIIGGALIIFMHRANIGRLMKGTENKFR
ncbi:MAG: glycerol-3-phosphate acyltransferase, partial [Acidobacteria bacterium]|nr:glycerol-3-phosphate acyltransferase [Acidobacteriota bacterium]